MVTVVCGFPSSMVHGLARLLKADVQHLRSELAEWRVHASSQGQDDDEISYCDFVFGARTSYHARHGVLMWRDGRSNLRVPLGGFGRRNVCTAFQYRNFSARCTAYAALAQRLHSWTGRSQAIAAACAARRRMQRRVLWQPVACSDVKRERSAQSQGVQSWSPQSTVASTCEGRMCSNKSRVDVEQRNMQWGNVPLP
ncbi:hypothetical protein MTO96_030842 [Rhipicephalus appendiculatus]